MLKSTLARKKYTTAGCGGCDKYELCVDFRFYYRIFQVLDHRDPLVGSGRSWSSWQHPQPHCAS